MKPDNRDLLLYFDPVDFEQFQENIKSSRHSLGYQIEKSTRAFSGPKPIKPVAAIFGVTYDGSTQNKGSALAPDEIRKFLYGLSSFESNSHIIDLGNLRAGKTEQDTYFALRDVTDYFTEAGIIAIVIGGGHDLTVGICRAFQGYKEFTLTIADSRIDLKKEREVSNASNFISKILRENPKLFHLQLIGVQKHFATPSFFEFLRQNTFDYIQLGSFRDNVAGIEPLIRNTHFLSFDISSVRKSDSTGNYQASPNGFYAEEACLISRYAGLSSRLTVFGLFEVNPQLDPNGFTSHLAAQMVWYFLEGTLLRRKEDPIISKESFTRFFVEVEDHSEPLVFYHHPATNRWWIEFFPQEGENWILACNDNSYKQAIKGEVPEIYWKYVRKTTRLSK